jgi:hypothetical protein
MFTITADRLPAQGGIDPTLKLIDRNPEDKCDEGREALAVVNGKKQCLREEPMASLEGTRIRTLRAERTN